MWGLAECALLLLVSVVGKEFKLFVGDSVVFCKVEDLNFLEGGNVLVEGCLRKSGIVVVPQLEPVISFLFRVEAVSVGTVFCEFKWAGEVGGTNVSWRLALVVSSPPGVMSRALRLLSNSCVAIALGD